MCLILLPSKHLRIRTIWAAKTPPEPSMVLAQVYNAPVINTPPSRDVVETTLKTTSTEICIKIVKINNSSNSGLTESYYDKEK